MEKDMSTGKPFEIIIKFTIPMLLGNVFQQFYNIADSVIVGKYVGSDALAAVGTSFPIVFLYVAVAMGLGMGGSIVISQYYGAKNKEKVRASITTTLIVLAGISVVLSIIGVATSRSLLELQNTPPEIIEQSVTYLKIYFSGLIFMFLYNTFAAIYRAIGDSKSPLYFLIVATILNIGLDLLFILKFNMGVSGAAWATVISQGFSAFLCYFYSQIKIPILRFKAKDIVCDRTLVKKILGLGVPAMIQQMVVSIGMMATQGLVNSYGPATIAGFTAATKIDSLATLPIMNLSMTMSTFTAQNIGAGKSERISEGFKATLTMIVIFSIFITAVIYIFGENLLNVFFDAEVSMEALESGMLYLKIVSLCYILFGVLFVTNGVLRGAGDMKVVTVSTIISLAIRIISAYSLNEVLGFKTVAVGIAIGWIFGILISTMRFISGKWRNNNVIE